jgi:hypothetical protein
MSAIACPPKAPLPPQATRQSPVATSLRNKAEPLGRQHQEESAGAARSYVDAVPTRRPQTDCRFRHTLVETNLAPKDQVECCYESPSGTIARSDTFSGARRSPKGADWPRPHPGEGRQFRIRPSFGRARTAARILLDRARSLRGRLRRLLASAPVIAPDGAHHGARRSSPAVASQSSRSFLIKIWNRLVQPAALSSNRPPKARDDAQAVGRANPEFVPGAGATRKEQGAS